MKTTIVGVDPKNYDAFMRTHTTNQRKSEYVSVRLYSPSLGYDQYSRLPAKAKDWSDEEIESYANIPYKNCSDWRYVKNSAEYVIEFYDEFCF